VKPRVRQANPFEFAPNLFSTVSAEHGVAMMRGAARVKRSWAFMRALAPKNVKRIPKKEKAKKEK
jgi:hypothetical protein